MFVGALGSSVFCTVGRVGSGCVLRTTRYLRRGGGDSVSSRGGVGLFGRDGTRDHGQLTHITATVTMDVVLFAAKKVTGTTAKRGLIR